MGNWFKVQDFWEYMEGGKEEEVTLLFKNIRRKIKFGPDIKDAVWICWLENMTTPIRLLSVFLLVWTCLSVTAEAAPFSSTVAEPASSVESTGTTESTTTTAPPDEDFSDEKLEWDIKEDNIKDPIESLVDARILELQTNLKYALKMRGLIKAFK